MRGGLDDRLDKLARRDELRRRAAGEATGTPPAVTDLVEAVAAVVARNPELAITMGVEGAGDPVLLHFAITDGTVRVSADKPLTTHVDAEPAAHRHPDFDFDLDPVDVAAPAPSSGAPTASSTEWVRRSDLAEGTDTGEAASDPPGVYGTRTTRHTHDRAERDATLGRRATDYDRPPTYGGQASVEPPVDGADEQAAADAYEPHPYRPHPYAPTLPPQVPPQTPASSDSEGKGAGGPRQMPEPLPTPVPLREEPKAAELAARRLAAMLREDPSLLRSNPHD